MVHLFLPEVGCQLADFPSSLLFTAKPDTKVPDLILLCVPSTSDEFQEKDEFLVLLYVISRKGYFPNDVARHNRGKYMYESTRRGGEGGEQV